MREIVINNFFGLCVTFFKINQKKINFVITFRTPKSPPLENNIVI